MKEIRKLLLTELLCKFIAACASEVIFFQNKNAWFILYEW